MLFNEYPYINLQDLNLDYILNIIKKIRSDLDDFVNLNTIKYADPINWNITKQYETNTIVVDPYDGTAYISVRPIPVGVSITNTEYWTPIFNYGDAIENIKSNVASNERHSETATKSYTANSLVWFNDDLYKTIVDMPAGTAFIVSENIVKCTVEDFIKLFINALQTALDNEIVARTDADTALQTALDNEITARTNTDTALQSALDNEIVARTNADTALQTALDNEITARTNTDTALQAEIDDLSDINVKNDVDQSFKAIRIGSANTNGCQSFVINNGVILSCDDNNSDEYLDITEIDYSTFSVLNSHRINTKIHPNACFMHDGLLYVVDSTEHKIYEINVTTFTVSTIITSFINSYIASANVDENGVVYLLGYNDLGARIVHKLNSNLTVIETIELDATTTPDFTINQGLFVYDSLIYLVKNRPNTLAVFNMDGSLVGFKEIGIGDGFYPYGEVEFLYYDGTDVLMAANPYKIISGVIYSYFQLFKTNIAHELSDGSIYGQAYPTSANLYVSDDTHNKNADGTSANAFDNLYEAGCVYSYNYDLTKYFSKIIINGDFSGKVGFLANCVVTIRSNDNIGSWYLYSCVTDIIGATFDAIDVRSGVGNFYKCIGNYYSYYEAFGVIDDCTINNLLQLNNSFLNKVDSNEPPSVVSSNSEIKKAYYRYSVNITSNTNMGVGRIIKHMLASETVSLVSLNLITIASSEVYTSGFNFSVTSSDKTALANGTPITIKQMLLGSGTEAFILPVTITIDSSYNVRLDKGSPLTLSGSAYSGSVSLYTTGMTIEQITK